MFVVGIVTAGVALVALVATGGWVVGTGGLGVGDGASVRAETPMSKDVKMERCVVEHFTSPVVAL